MVIKKTYFKGIFREIKGSFGRFIAIIAIVALGVGFLVGILSATPDMKYSVDQYYDKNNMTDIFIKSAEGLSQKDLDTIRALPETDHVTPAYVTDTLADTSLNETLVARIYGIDLKQSSGDDFVNRLTLTEGRMPQNDSECVIQSPNGELSDLPLGTKLTVSRENAGYDKIGYIYKTMEYTVVGIVSNPFYFSSETEQSSIGNGKVGAIVYVNESCYALPAYTDFYLTLNNTAKLDSFSREYTSTVSAVAEKIKVMSPGWYVLDRGSNTTYATYKVNVEKVADVAKVFPIFFFLVAALVTLTTMTRMVEEERGQIGTFKALGYTRWAIMSKYLSYCFFATAIGCAIGLAFGFQLLPVVLNHAYAAMYQLPPFLPQFEWTFALISCGFEILCTLGATYLVCIHSMKEKPAFLMLPRAPKPGKRILLEKIKPLWSRMSFTYKSTARNIFRYKKHLLMSVVGIAGCTTLILTGFGLRDSMNDIANTQFQKIFLYDMKIDLKDSTQDAVLTDFLKGKESLRIHSESGVINNYSESTDNEDQKIKTTIYVPESFQHFGDYIALIDRKTNQTISPSGKTVIITEKMADTLDIGIGETFQMENQDHKSAVFTVTGITENYVGCYAYLDQATYQSAYGDVTLNALLVKSGITDPAEQDKAVSKILTSGSVSNVGFNSQIKKSYDNLLSSLGYIVIVILLSAGALAVVVLYNLTNININERIKELATLRVLGYRHRDVAAYIFREISILSVLGTIVGLGLGMLLHRYVITTAETVDLMFGRTISPFSFILSAAATLLFSVIVDLMMAGRIRKIKMAESMKAVD